MGWCSGTEIAEVVMKEFPYDSVDQEQQVAFFKKFIEAMWEQDWDCEADMDYMTPSFFIALSELDGEMASGLKEMWEDHAENQR